MAALNLANWILSVVGAALLVPVTVFFVEIVFAFKKHRQRRITSEPVRFVVLIPAHNEAEVIGKTLESVGQQLSADDEILVVADNCNDNTGEIAEKFGARVVYRNDPSRRGKGYALDFGIQALAADPPDVVTIVDADCVPGPSCLETIASLANTQQRPVQAHYAMRLPSAGVTRNLKIAAFAWRVKNGLRPLGLHRLGLPCQLMGTGMAFPWKLISRVDLATSEIVEDLTLGLDLAKVGHAPLYCPDVEIWSWFPVNEEGQDTQRTRWETGHINTIVRRVPELIGRALKDRNGHALAMAIDVAVPPLAFLTILVAVFLVLSASSFAIGAPKALLWLATLTLSLFTCAIGLAWWRAGRDIISPGEMCLAPFYVLSKVALYGRILVGRRVSWIRSSRHGS